jgi:hypothetical protein
MILMPIPISAGPGQRIKFELWKRESKFKYTEKSRRWSSNINIITVCNVDNTGNDTGSTPSYQEVSKSFVQNYLSRFLTKLW